MCRLLGPLSPLYLLLTTSLHFLPEVSSSLPNASVQSSRTLSLPSLEVSAPRDPWRRLSPTGLAMVRAGMVHFNTSPVSLDVY